MLGTNGNGQLGDGTTPWVKTPSMVYGLNPAVVTANYYNGQPGSKFLISGTNFLPGNNATIMINGYTFATKVPIDSNGNFSFLLVSTPSAGVGKYILAALNVVNASLRFSLDPSDPIRDSSGGSVILTLPDALAILEIQFLAYGPR